VTRSEKLLELSKSLKSCLHRRGALPGGDPWYEIDERELIEVLTDLIDLIDDDKKYLKASSTGWTDTYWRDLE
jgi:hypothetical protein